MKIIDAGHKYQLQTLDGDEKVELRFVKREGPGYPGNVGSHSGTNIQDVLRVCIDRVKYLNNQIWCEENKRVIEHLRWAIYELETRAAHRHKRNFFYGLDSIEGFGTCTTCGHIGCVGH